MRNRCWPTKTSGKSRSRVRPIDAVSKDEPPGNQQAEPMNATRLGQCIGPSQRSPLGTPALPPTPIKPSPSESASVDALPPRARFKTWKSLSEPNIHRFPRRRLKESARKKTKRETPHGLVVTLESDPKNAGKLHSDELDDSEQASPSTPEKIRSALGWWRSPETIGLVLILAFFATTRNANFLRCVPFLMVGRTLFICARWVRFFMGSPGLARLIAITQAYIKLASKEVGKSREGGMIRRRYEAAAVKINSWWLMYWKKRLERTSERMKTVGHSQAMQHFKDVGPEKPQTH